MADSREKRLRKYTETGRVVYDRKTHFFRESDFFRIARALEIDRKKAKRTVYEFFQEVLVQQYQTWIDNVISNALEEIRANLIGKVGSFTYKPSDEGKKLFIIEENDG